VARRSHRMQKYKFGVTCPERDKKCCDVSCLERTEKHYVTHRSHRIQKHKFNITFSNALFIKSIPVSPEHDK
jgi:hypothetical protein